MNQVSNQQTKQQWKKNQLAGMAFSWTMWLESEAQAADSSEILKTSLGEKTQGQWYGLSFHGVLTRVKLLGEAAQRLMLVRFHSWITSFVFSSTLITLSLVIPSRRGTSLFLPFIFSYRKIK